MMESPPASPLEVSQAEFALQFLIVAFDRPAFGVEVDDPGRARGRIADGQMPSLLHSLGVDADRRADLVAGRSELGAAQKARALSCRPSPRPGASHRPPRSHERCRESG